MRGTRYFLRLCLAFTLALLLAGCSREVIGILEPASTEAVDEARIGFLEALRDAGYKSGENVRFLRRSAEAREKPLDELARELIEEEEVELLLALSTAGLQAAIGATRERPIIFAASGLPPPSAPAPGATPSPTNVTGAATQQPIDEVLQLVRRLLPSATRLGILSASEEPDSTTAAQGAWAAAQQAGFIPLSQVAATPEDVLQATRRLLAEGAQVIYVAPAALLEAQFSKIAGAAEAAGVPVLAWSEQLAKAGALASIGIDYRDNGRRAGAVAARVLNGEQISQVPVSTGGTTHLWLNQRVAQSLGIAIPEELLVLAKRVVH